MVIAAGNELLNIQHLLAEILKIGVGATVVDFGCGATAINSLTAARLIGEKGQVYAVDILKTVLSSVESHIQHEGLVNVKTIWADLEKLNSTKLPTESADFVLLVNILFQIKDRPTILTEARRLLKFGGKALIVEWQPRNEGVGPVVERRLAEETMRQELEQAGFTIETSFTAGPHHYGMVVIK